MQLSGQFIEDKMMKNKVRFPFYEGGEYECLEDVIRAFKKDRWRKLSSYICDIVEYNILYRDCLRENGIDRLIEQLCAEAPSFRDEESAIKEFHEWYSKLGGIADYDIQCYGIDDAFNVLGHTFQGLQEIRQRVEMFCFEGYSGFKIFTPEETVSSPDGLHVGMMFESYPKFDSYDAGDDRSYDNYIIRKKEISKSDMEKLAKVPSLSNDKRIHEHIPADMLPILYYRGSGNYMLLATAKEQQ